MRLWCVRFPPRSIKSCQNSAEVVLLLSYVNFVRLEVKCHYKASQEWLAQDVAAVRQVVKAIFFRLNGVRQVVVLIIHLEQ